MEKIEMERSSALSISVAMTCAGGPPTMSVTNSWIYETTIGAHYIYSYYSLMRSLFIQN